MPADNTRKVQIAEMYIYPVKSLAGIRLDTATLTTSGLEHDRQWVIVQDNGYPLTQRQQSKMALLHPQLNGNDLTLHHDEAGSMLVHSPSKDLPVEKISVWMDTCFGRFAEKEVNQWLSEVLESKELLRLAKVDRDQYRIAHHPDRFNVQTQNFSDAGPYLIVNASSLIALNKKLAEENLEPIDIRRFRPNIVLEGIEAFTEHQVHTLTSNDEKIKLGLIDHCQRCVTITINPDTGERAKDTSPFPQLAQINPMPNKPKAPAFGVNARLIVGEGAKLCVGDTMFAR